MLVLTSLADVAFAGKIKLPPVADVDIDEQTPKNFRIELGNTGGGVIVKFTVTQDSAESFSGGGENKGWTRTVIDSNTFEWKANGKAALGSGDSTSFMFTMNYEVTFTATWNAYDRKGNQVGTGQYFHNP